MRFELYQHIYVEESGNHVYRPAYESNNSFSLFVYILQYFTQPFLDDIDFSYDWIIIDNNPKEFNLKCLGFDEPTEKEKIIERIAECKFLRSFLQKEVCLDDVKEFQKVYNEIYDETLEEAIALYEKLSQFKPIIKNIF